ncbi:DUF2267 domain-containing protein [Leptolyngbya sp. KIOST-1]|uniref:DUF2267 domain-containing protein n=1 Tax=Leptolyngbya sp. KIOST-1 TaxID=1229172 RepID=UPI00055CAE9E|nr:DUF2267 domain-containing protein [Leptolyngbya sp. KIOST-1]
MVDATKANNPSGGEPANAQTSRPEIADRDRPFLEKVATEGGFPDVYDARDFTEIVFRVMRDLMTTEAADRVAKELKNEDTLPNANDKSLHMDVVELWRDTNPLVGFLSRVRPPWQGPGIFKIDSDRFMFRVANEGGLKRPQEDKYAVRSQAVKAVFSATKAELSQERIQEIATWMPEGEVLDLWQQA